MSRLDTANTWLEIILIQWILKVLLIAAWHLQSRLSVSAVHTYKLLTLQDESSLLRGKWQCSRVCRAMALPNQGQPGNPSPRKSQNRPRTGRKHPTLQDNLQKPSPMVTSPCEEFPGCSKIISKRHLVFINVYILYQEDYSWRAHCSGARVQTTENLPTGLSPCWV